MATLSASLRNVAGLLHVAADEILQRGGGEEIFLPQPQLLTGRRRVARVEHLGDRLGAHLFGERADMVALVEGVETQRIGRARRPQAQRVHMPAAPADDRRVIGDGDDGFGRTPDMREHAVGESRAFDMAAEADVIGDLRARELPGVAEGQPVLRIFVLPAVLDRLAEQAVIVADAIAHRGDFERRHAVHETGGESAEAAIAERRVGLDLAQLVEIDAELRRARRAWRPVRSRLVSVSISRRPIEKFEREIINAPPVLCVVAFRRGEPAFDETVARGEGGRDEPVARTRGRVVLADRIGETALHLAFQLGDGSGVGRVVGVQISSFQAGPRSPAWPARAICRAKAVRSAGAARLDKEIARVNNALRQFAKARRGSVVSAKYSQWRSRRGAAPARLRSSGRP